MLRRIENGLESGWPDVYGIKNGVSVWVELKAPEEPKRSTTRLMSGNHELSREQRNWHMEHCQAGGNSWILIETDQQAMLVHGIWADRINDLSAQQLANLSNAFCVRPTNQNFWDSVSRAIFKC